MKAMRQALSATTRSDLKTAIWLFSLLFLLIISWSGGALAGILFSSTRVVFPTDKMEQYYRIASVSDYPVIVQVWVDDGAPDGSPDTAVSPFVTLPPVFRLNPNGIQGLRIIYNGENQVKDRESLYWLNVYEIPPTPKGIPDNAASLALATKTQIKLFLRPAGLAKPGSDLVNKLKFSINKQSAKAYLKVSNPTPFYITLGKLELAAGRNKQTLATDMVAPFSDYQVEIVDFAKVNNPSLNLEYSIIDDTGEPVVAKIAIK